MDDHHYVFATDTFVKLQKQAANSNINNAKSFSSYFPYL
jgi:hypothetical protein